MSKRERDSEKCDDGTEFNFSEPGFDFNESDDEFLGGLPQEFLESEDIIGETAQTFFEDNDSLMGEVTQGFIEASQVFQNLPLYNQVGSVFESKPDLSSSGTVYVEELPPPPQIDDVSFNWNYSFYLFYAYLLSQLNTASTTPNGYFYHYLEEIILCFL
nr:uncharacterized protein LOC107450663 [Parasteatoda tepidariorum]